MTESQTISNVVVPPHRMVEENMHKSVQIKSEYGNQQLAYKIPEP